MSTLTGYIGPITDFLGTIYTRQAIPSKYGWIGEITVVPKHGQTYFLKVWKNSATREPFQTQEAARLAAEQKLNKLMAALPQEIR
ncbi:MAG TPA: hypothetical protein VKZ53_17030 [Candidatus Angelobacter sp.]|nr:hypothetical protein [Candidatus Angelobacter sp.]